MGQSGQQNPRTGSGSVTSKDVAARAGVSVASVCRVFDKKWKGRVSAKLEQKVLAAAQELGYHPNALARGLISKRSGIIGVVMSEEFNSFYFDLFCRMTNLIQELGMRVMVFNAAAYRNLQDIFNCFLAYQVDGIIITAASLAAGFESLKGDTPFPAPVILVNVYRHSTAWPSVICDNRRGTREMARYLYDMGGREFLFLSAFKSQYYDVEERLEGFRSGLEACGPHRLHIEYGDYTYESGREIARRVLSRKERPDTVFSTGTRMALGYMDAARYSFGLRIPADFNIAAYDDLIGAQFQSYDLTCIEQPSQELAEKAVQLLSDALNGAPQASRIYREPPRLRLRGSVSRRRPVLLSP